MLKVLSNKDSKLLRSDNNSYVMLNMKYKRLPSRLRHFIPYIESLRIVQERLDRVYRMGRGSDSNG